MYNIDNILRSNLRAIFWLGPRTKPLKLFNNLESFME